MSIFVLAMEDIDYTRLLNIMDPPEAIEIVAEVQIYRHSLIQTNLSEDQIKESICLEIAKELLKKDLVQFKSVESPAYDFISYYGKIKLFEHKYKLKLLI